MGQVVASESFAPLPHGTELECFPSDADHSGVRPQSYE